MTALECLRAAESAGDEYQRPINVFIDAFRRAGLREREQLVRDPILNSGSMEGLVPAVVSALCRETGTPTPSWTEGIHGPRPFFALPARTFAMRLRLMVESPVAFRIRNVFVSADSLSRA